MKKLHITVYIFIFLAAVQLVVPAAMMARWEYVLMKGEEFKFRVNPIDPVDVFRGRYVSIYLRGHDVKLPEGMTFDKDGKLYALLGRDDKGFGTVVSISADEPAEGAYVCADAFKGYDYGSKHTHVSVSLPFKVYYMNEYRAPIAEQLTGWGGASDAYITVKVLGGRAVISGLYINGKKAEDLARGDLNRGMQR